MEQRTAAIQRARELEFSLLGQFSIEVVSAKACANLGDIYKDDCELLEEASKFHRIAGNKYSQSSDSILACVNYFKAIDSYLKTNEEGSKLCCIKALHLISAALKATASSPASSNMSEAQQLCVKLSETLRSHTTVKLCSLEISSVVAAVAATTTSENCSYITCVLDAAVFLSAKGCYKECYDLVSELGAHHSTLMMDIAVYLPHILSAVLSGNIAAATNIIESFKGRLFVAELEQVVRKCLDKDREKVNLDIFQPIAQSNQWIDLLLKRLELQSCPRAQSLQLLAPQAEESTVVTTPVKNKGGSATAATSTTTSAELTALGSTTLTAASKSKPSSSLPENVRVIYRKKEAGFGIVIENVLTREECQQWILDTENSTTGYEEALVNIGYGQQEKMLDIRKSARCIIDDAVRAEELWQRVKRYVPSELSYCGETWRALELNERLRFLRYDKGEYFRPHSDGAYVRPNDGRSAKCGDRSMVTFQLYLNEDCFGGTTRFFGYEVEDLYDVVPKAGSVLLFEHPLRHSGEEVTAGRKYAMRTDVMYTKSSY